MNVINPLFFMYPFLVYFIAGFIGLLIGSFLNVCIYRIPVMINQEELAITAPTSSINLFFPKSFCPNCFIALKTWHKIPLISYCLLKGKCATCQKPISQTYPIIELISAITAIICVHHYGLSIKALLIGIMLAYLFVLSIIDIKTGLLPDILTLSLLWIGLAISIKEVFCTPSEAILGAIFGYLFLWCIYWLFKLIFKIEGMGHGDFKLLSALGAWLGWVQLPQIIFFASCFGIICGIIILKIKKQSLKHHFAFGPYLSIAGMITMLFPNLFLKIFL